MDGYVIIGTELDTKSFEKQIEDVKAKLDDVEQTLQMASEDKTLFSTSEIREMEKEAEKLRNRLVDLYKKQAQVEKTDFSSIKSSLENIGNSVQNITKKVVRWGLAVFGIRSAYNFVRQSISTLSQYNEQMATDIEYIRYALASTLQPVIERIIQLVYKLLSYFAYIIKAWTGKNIFANANKSLKNATGSAKALNKELNKTIAGFDEMNVLQDTSSGGGADAGGGVAPSFDLSQFEGEVPKWLQWIADNKDLILSVMAGVAAGLLAWELGLTALRSLGIGIAIAGIVYVIQGLIAYLKDPSWNNFGKVITGIGLAVTGVAIAIGAWPVAVAGVVVAILGIIISNWEKIKEFFQNGINWLKEKGDWIHNTFGDVARNIYDSFVRSLQRVLDWFDLTFSAIKKIFDGIIEFVKGVFTGNWSQAWEGVKKIFSGIWDWISGTARLVLEELIDKAKTIASTVGNVISGVFKAVVNGILSTIETVLNTPIKTVNKLIDTINKVPGINIGKLSTFNLPRLAKGGIINMPGRGVPVGGAIGGERGQEGVIPLTDSQQMELLGEAIGRYITINANITNTMNGRVISRELKKVQNENDFAYNS